MVIEEANVQTTLLLKVTCAYLPVKNKLASAGWYAKHFGLKLNPRTADDPKLANGQTLFLLPVRDAGTTSNFRTPDWGPGFYDMFPICFETDCIFGLHDHLKGSGVQVEALKDEGECGYQFVYSDPDGNRFLVWQDTRTKERAYEPEIPSLIRIASVYLPVTDPQASFDWYISSLKLKTSGSGQPVLEDGTSLFFLRTAHTGVTSNFHTTDWKPGGCEMPMFNVQVRNIHSVREHLLKQGVKVGEINDAGACGLGMMVHDPDGNMLELWEEHGNP